MDTSVPGRASPRLGLLSLAVVAAAACGGGEGPPDTQPSQPRSSELVQTCTAQSIRGTPLQGTLCGGDPARGTNGCEPGVLYRCTNATSNNCTLLTACAVGCETSGNLADTCYSGPAPLTVTPTSTTGGNEVTATVTLTEAHPHGVIDNMRINKGDLIAARAFCNVQDIPATGNSASFNMPTAVVSAPTPVNAWTILSFTTAAGSSRDVVSRTTTVTLQPGGTTPPPPALASFTLSPSSIAPGGVSLMDATLAHMAPAEALPAAQGTLVHVTSANPAVASVIANGQPVIQPGCTTGGGAETIQAANSVPQQTVVNISATTGDPGNKVVTNPITVTAGCTPKSCFDLPANQCAGPDGCGGTLACGCSGGQVCGSNGMCGTAPPSPGVSSLSLNPSSLRGGSSSTGTVTLNMAAPSGGLGVFFSSSSASATPPGSIVIPAGQTSATFPVSTSRVGSTTSATITASSNGSASAVLTITP
ncbi:MAG: hypothetical protein ACJ781_00950 [Myxococcales bacterium]